MLKWAEAHTTVDIRSSGLKPTLRKMNRSVGFSPHSAGELSDASRMTPRREIPPPRSIHEFRDGTLNTLLWSGE